MSSMDDTRPNKPSLAETSGHIPTADVSAPPANQHALRPQVAIPGQGTRLQDDADAAGAAGNQPAGGGDHRPPPPREGGPHAAGEAEGRSAEANSTTPNAASAPLSEGEQVLADLRAQIKRFVVMPSEEALTAATLWAAATHLQTAWQHAPRLAIVGPVRRCGKSRLMEVLIDAVHDPLITVNASAAAIFRSITEEPPTLLVDEADTIFGSPKVAEKNEEMRGLLNAGHQRNRPTLRVSGPNHDVAKFPTFAMAALAGIGDLPDTIMDRSVVIRMRRRAETERVEPFRSYRDIPVLNALRDRLAAWLHPLHAAAMETEPAMPVEDRAADTWEPLIVVADLAEGQWPALARTACQVMTGHEAGKDEDGGLKIRILVDIRRAFTAEDQAVLRTSRLLDCLNADKEAPWAEYSANGLTPRGLQLLLKDYGINAVNRRFPDGTQARGFARNQFLDAWARYCPERPAGPTQETDTSAPSNTA